ncbi:hypothetical protein EP47_05925 [Legionella norrlandica]|uniref:Uncharacterized protein n=1 Tax=Legionella norrlandica TaxID=1498499 RepID=A0A0A2SWD3_9GAMM|nr:hypothetical protein [Legionella norrlandica]KGP63759.1 hypothetical protein EP47_05925 [Legionella norrlandica]
MSTKAQELVKQYKLRLTPKMEKELLSVNSGLRKEIESVPFNSDDRLYKSVLQMIIVFYEENTLEKNRHLLQDYELIRQLSALIWDDIQIKLIPFLIQKNFSINKIKELLFEEVCYRSLYVLVEFGLTQDIQQLLADQEKREQLNFINKLTDENCRKLCLIFWVKSHLSIEEIQDVVKASKQYPMLAETLIALDKTKTISIKQLKKLALDPKEHQQESILYHYSKQCKVYGLHKSDLSKLDLEDLSALGNSFKVLNEAGITSGYAYRWAIKNNKKGQLLRLFLPGLAKIEDLPHRKALINLLCIGVQKGVVTQGKALLQITDPDLLTLARKLHERFICVQQMQDLRFKKEIISFASEENDVRASRFRYVIMKVEEKCKDIHERLLKSAVDSDKVGNWQNADEKYRQTLYSIAYDGITKSGIDLHLKMKSAEKEILSIVDPEIKSLLHKALIVIANIVITALTLGFANDLKERQTGNYWFFNQTRSGEVIRALNKEVLTVIDSSDLMTLN